MGRLQVRIFFPEKKVSSWDVAEKLARRKWIRKNTQFQSPGIFKKKFSRRARDLGWTPKHPVGGRQGHAGAAFFQQSHRQFCHPSPKTPQFYLCRISRLWGHWGGYIWVRGAGIPTWLAPSGLLKPWREIHDGPLAHTCSHFSFAAINHNTSAFGQYDTAVFSRRSTSQPC